MQLCQRIYIKLCNDSLKKINTLLKLVKNRDFDPFIILSAFEIFSDAFAQVPPKKNHLLFGNDLNIPLETCKYESVISIFNLLPIIIKTLCHTIDLYNSWYIFLPFHFSFKKSHKFKKIFLRDRVYDCENL